MSKDKNFNFWLPVSLEKAKDSKGVEKMIMKGVASTKDVDSDGEVLLPEGFDLDYFLNKGVVNWHHQSKTNPAAVIGEPLKAEIKKGNLYTEVELYADSPLAKQVYELGETLEKSSKTRRLGFSIEGKALERDPKDKKRITKAKITGLAITHMPKNAATFCEIMKGEVDGLEYDEEQIENDLELFKSETGEDFGIIEKSLSAESNGAELTKESLKKEVVEVAKNKDEEEEEEEDEKTLSKSKIFTKIFTEYPEMDITKAKKIFNLIEKTSLIMKKDINGKIIITDETIEKSFAILGLAAEDNEENVILKAKEAVVAKKAADEDEDEDDVENDDVDESEDSEDVVKKSFDNDLEKAFDQLSGDFSEKLGDIEKSIQTSNEDAIQSFKSVGTIMKSMMDTMGELSDKVEQIGKTPFDRKSTTRRSAALEKSFNGDSFQKGGQSQVRTLSKSQNKKDILNILENKTFTNGGVDDTFAKAMTTFESSNVILPDAAKLLLLDNIMIVD